MKNFIKQLSFSFTKENLKQKILLYLYVICTPVLLLLGINLCNTLGFFRLFTYLIGYRTISINGIAAGCFLFYLKHTERFHLSAAWEYLVSISYGLCSFGVLQEKHLPVLILYAFFPLLFLSYEKMTQIRAFLPFILLAAFALILSPEASIPVMLLLYVLSIIELCLAHKISFGNVLHISACFLLADIIAAFRILSYLAPYYSAHESYSYGGFGFIQDLFPFLARFFPGVSPSGTYLFVNDSIDLCFGMLFLFFGISFLFCKRINLSRRITYTAFTLLVLGTVELTPVKYIFYLFIDPDKAFISHAFFVVFWCLLLACHVISLGFSKKTIMIGSNITLLILLGVLLGSSHNFHLPVFGLLFVLLILYTILLFALASRKNSSFLSALLILTVLLEAASNIVVSSAQSLYQPKHTTYTQWLWKQKKNTPSDSNAEADAPINSPLSQSELKAWLTSHQDDELNKAFDTLHDVLKLSDADLKNAATSAYAFPDFFETDNIYFRTAGYTDDFFQAVEFEPIFNPSEMIRIEEGASHIFYFTPSPDINLDDFYATEFYIDTNEAIPDTEHYQYHLFFSSPVLSYDMLLDKEMLLGASPCYIPTQFTENSTQNIQILFARYKKEDLSSLYSFITDYVSLHTSDFSLSVYDYLGLIISIIGFFILMLLFFNSEKEKIYQRLLQIKCHADTMVFPHLVKKHITKYYVYYLSFFIPFLLFIVGMIYADCTPFGTKSFFDGDGVALTFPSYLDYYYNLLQRNTALTLNAGYGSSISATNPSIFLLFFYRLFKPSQIPALLLFGEAFCLGLSGLFMSYYMTHRLNSRKAYFRDYRLLAPALIYSLNGYMLSVHSFTSWYLVLCAFPLVMLGMEYLIFEKKWFLYTITLGICIIINIQLALYICIFLVIIFFTFRFQNLKDFVFKGIRFAGFSILSAGIGFYSIANTLLETYDSNYHEEDSIFPSLGLHTSFLEQWKKNMLFSYSHAVTNDNGDIALYCSIFALFFVLLYFMATKHTVREKLSVLTPILFLCISFNGQVLSYLWDGLHYQVKMPNRYVFLLAFMIARLSYDGFIHYCRLTASRITIAGAILLVFLCVCHFGSTGVSTISLICSLIAAVTYFILTLLAHHKRTLSRKLSAALVYCLLFEITINMFYSIHLYDTGEILLYGDYEATEKSVHELLFQPGRFDRICYPSIALSNIGMTYNTPCGSVFNSYVTKHQTNLNKLYGFYEGVNVSTANYESTPFGNMLCANRYLFVHTYTNAPLKGLSSYQYLGKYKDNYVFENKKALSLGYYVPTQIKDLKENLSFPPIFWDNFVKYYTGKQENLFDIYTITYDNSAHSENTFYFTDFYGNEIDYERAAELFLSTESSGEPIYDIYMNINLNINNEGGKAYLYTWEPVCLGDISKNTTTQFTTMIPNESFPLGQTYYILVMHQDILEDFYNEISQNQLTDISIQNDSITGKSDYKEAGYTMFSLAYDRSWHAYIDGVETEVADPFHSCVMIKTPSGKHTITLRYIPYGMKKSKLISLLCLLFVFGLYAGGRFHQRKKNSSLGYARHDV